MEIYNELGIGEGIVSLEVYIQLNYFLKTKMK